MTVKRALLSVYRKDGIVDLAKGLASRGFEIVSTGGTADALKKEGVKVTGVSEATGFPEILDGRVKTLHPTIHGGILARRDVAEHKRALAEHKIPPIDVVVVNLYPFEDKVAKGASFADAIENIDVGGPKPAAVFAFPVGFVGAVESKAELVANPRSLAFATLPGRRGGSAMAAAAINALAGNPEESTGA